MRKALVSILFIVNICVSAEVFAIPHSRLAQVKQQIIEYHQSGAYEYDLEKLVEQANAYLSKRIAENNSSKHHKKLAVVFDVDDTALSNYQYFKTSDFSDNSNVWNKVLNNADSPPLIPIKNIYQYAVGHGVKIFFITGRREAYRKQTEINLLSAGYTVYEGLYLQSNNYNNLSAAPFKTKARMNITKKGYEIIANFGDHYSDLRGGYAERIYKLPNYIY